MDSKLLNYAKSPIPVLDSIAPRSYVIMPALLASMDSAITLDTTSILSQQESTKATNYSNNKPIHNNNNHNYNVKSSKEIVYTTKRIIKLSMNYFDHNHITREHQYVTVNKTKENFINESCDADVNESRSSNAAVLVNPTNGYITDSFVNSETPSEPASLISSDMFINSSLSEPDVSSSTQSSLSSSFSSQFPITHTNTDQNREIRLFNNGYTISCPADCQLNIRKMLSCGVLLKSRTLWRRRYEIKLKCSVCNLSFNQIDDLIEHKHNNYGCKNNINIINEKIGCDLAANSSNSSSINDLDSDNPVNLSFDSDSEFHQDEDDEDENESSVCASRHKKWTRKSNITATTNNTDAAKRLVVYARKDGGVLDANGRRKRLYGENKPRRKYTKVKANSETCYNCDKCNKKCRTKAEMLVHAHKHAGKGPECWECGKTCASFSNLVSHVQLHTGEKPYTCQICAKQFTQDAHLTRHLRLHTGERPFVCNICGKNYKDYSYFKTHLRIHKGERLYKCNYCNKEYYDASYYKKHTRLHTGEKPFMCTVCGKQFHRSDYLKLHSYSHTDERPFNCDLCGKGFKMKYTLKTHLRLAHHMGSSTEIDAVINDVSHQPEQEADEDEIDEEEEEERIIHHSNQLGSHDEETNYNEDTTFDGYASGRNNVINNTTTSLTSINLNLNDPKLNSIVPANDSIAAFYIQDVDMDLRS